MPKADWYVLETGCFSCAGLYKMDCDKVVNHINRIALEDWGDVYEINSGSNI